MTGTSASHIWAFHNQKGGVGKSSAAVSVASLLAAHFSKRVAVLDLDKEAFATTIALGQSVAHDPLHDDPVIVRGASAGASEMLLFAGSAAIGVADEVSIARHIARAGQAADILVIDTPPDGQSPAVMAALRAATTVVIPVMPDFQAMAGMQRLLANTVRLGVRAPVRALLSRWEPRTRLAQDVHQQIVACNPGITLSSIVPRDQRVAEAMAAGCPVPVFAKRSAATAAYRTATYELAALAGPSIPHGAL